MENAKHDRECTDCDLETTERLNYFTGQFLTERDFRAEQEYQIGKHRQHNRYLHGYGTVCGLKIVQHLNPDCQDRFVILEPGLALDCCGREIVVKEKVYIDLVKLFAAQNIDLNSIDPQERNHLLFSLCYEECKTEFVPALYSECGCDEFGCDANRIIEGFGVKLQLLKDLPKPLHQEPDGIGLDWITTLSLDNAIRVVLDHKGARIYVLTAANPGQIMVYDATHHCLLHTISLLGKKPGIPEGRGVDLTISPTGEFLYVLRYVETIAGTPGSGNYFLQVIQVKDPTTKQDLNPAQRIETTDASGDLPLSSGSADKPPQIVISQKNDSNKVYTLDLIAPKITIWNAQIITKVNANPTITAGNTNSPKLYEVSTGTDPRNIAVSPNDNWVFLAEAGTDNAIKVFKVETSGLGTSPSSISTNDPPILLAVSRDNLRLYAVTNPTTGDKKVRSFRLEESSQTFIEIKPLSGSSFSGIEIGTNTPVAIAVSQSGKWAYVLLKTSDGKGIIKVIDGDKIATEPDRALSESVTVVSDPQGLVLDPKQQRIYVAGKGNAETKTCGGVSVIDVKEAQCSELIWKALDGCPECPDDNCVPLAIVESYIRDYENNPKITNDRIENRKYRPLVTSTETLKQLVMCALKTDTGGTEGTEGKNGDKGDKGDPGIPGIKGDKGDLGEGLENGLTQIKALSWIHNTSDNPFVTITRLNPNSEVKGIVIAFTNEVLVSNFSEPFDPPNQMDAEHVFQVLIEHDPKLKKLGIVCRCPIKGRILPVKPTISNGRITKATEVKEPMAKAAAFIFDDYIVKFDENKKLLLLANETIQVDEIWVRLHGDFVIDKNKKAIDAEFVRAELPTGDRPKDSQAGIQGGVFESWFWIGERPKPG
jgi:DNA-binding beta-propeller fold protein YncE